VGRDRESHAAQEEVPTEKVWVDARPFKEKINLRD